MADFRAAGNAIGNSGKGPKRVIILVIVLLVLIFVFRHKIIDTYQNVVHKVSEAFDGNKKSKSTYLVDDVRDDVVEDEPGETSESNQSANEVVYVVTESAINIRDGAGVDCKQIGAASRGDEFIGTGNVEEASNGRPWYEVYLNDDRTKTGWISSKVSSPKEE